VPTLAATYDVGPAPWHPTFGPDGRTLYFGNKGANTVTAFDTQTATATVIEDDAFAQPHGSALGPDGRFLYVSNTNAAAGTGADGRVVVIDTQTNAVEAVIDVGPNPTGVGSARPE
jgi:YVTN family beta-propeller protein